MGHLAEFTSVMGTDRRDKTCEGPPYVTEDTIKLPHLEKPQWMGEIESALRSASPPKVGIQATRQIIWLSWVDSFEKGANFSTFSQDGASSECSGDTVVPGSPWEKISAAQIKKWRIATKKAMALPLGTTIVSVVRMKVLRHLLMCTFS